GGSPWGKPPQIGAGLLPHFPCAGQFGHEVPDVGCGALGMTSARTGREHLFCELCPPPQTRPFGALPGASTGGSCSQSKLSRARFQEGAASPGPAVQVHEAVRPHVRATATSLGPKTPPEFPVAPNHAPRE